jgi:hypothetical protein
MDIFIIAIDHYLQLASTPDESANLKAQKHQLVALLNKEVLERGVQFIAEESDPTRATLAQGLANAAQIPWKNIIMTNAERDAAGIREALANRGGHPDEETMTWWIEYRVPEDEVRETFFIEETLYAANGVQSILMLLGDMHVEFVGTRLAQMGHCVSTNHDLVPISYSLAY